MSNGTRKWAQGREREESYESAIRVEPQPARRSPESRTTAGRKGDDFVKTILSDEAEGVKVLEDRGSGVILLKFDQAPHPDIQRMMEARGFKWAAIKAAWAQPISHEGRVAARELIEATRVGEPAKVLDR